MTARTKTIRFRQLYKPEQEAKFIIEVQDDDGRNTWRRVALFVERSRAEGYVDGYKAGLKHFDTGTEQTSVPTFQDEWPRT